MKRKATEDVSPQQGDEEGAPLGGMLGDETETKGANDRITTIT